MNRRKFIKKTALGTLGLGFLAGLYSWQIEPFNLEFVKKKMPIDHLPENLIGKTLMQISDIHIGDRFDYQFIIDSFEKAKQFQPDFVIYTGDFSHYKSEKQIGQLKEVLPHFIKGKLGTVGVLGNHDYGKNWSELNVADEITSILESEEIRILRNEQISIENLNFIGFDDYWSPKFNPKKVMNQYNPEIANLVLCHNPDACDDNIWNGYKGWILAGHTHGGQCKLPWLPAPILPVKNKNYSAGEIDLNDGRTLYINRAIGHSFQIRLNVRPEITLFELKNLDSARFDYA